MASTHDPTTSATASVTPDLFKYSSVVIYIALCHAVTGITRPDFAGPRCDVRLPESRQIVNIRNVPPSDSEHSECPTVGQSTFPLSDTRTLGHSDTRTLRHSDTQMLGHVDTRSVHCQRLLSQSSPKHWIPSVQLETTDESVRT